MSITIQILGSKCKNLYHSSTFHQHNRHRHYLSTVYFLIIEVLIIHSPSLMTTTQTPQRSWEPCSDAAIMEPQNWQFRHFFLGWNGKNKNTLSWKVCLLFALWDKKKKRQSLTPLLHFQTWTLALFYCTEQSCNVFSWNCRRATTESENQQQNSYKIANRLELVALVTN